MAQPQHTPALASLEEAITLLFCLVDDAYASLNLRWRNHESLERLSDSEVLSLALFQQLRGVQSERSFLRDAQRFFSHLFPGVVGLARFSSFHRRVRKLGRFLEPSWSPCAGRSCPSFGRRAREPHRRLDALGGATPAPGGALGGLGSILVRGGVGEVGIVRRLWDQAPPPVRHQPRARLLRDHRC